MSREYGIDPEAINTYETFFQVIPHFGSRHFRYIRRYPKKWSSMVKRAVDNIAPRAKARIIEKLIQIDKELVDCLSDHNGNPTYNGTISWFDNANSFHSIQPFDGIITSTTNGCSYVCDIYSLDIDTNPIFKPPYRVRRTADEMASIAKQLLQHAREIHFVDPHFEKLNQRHFRPLKKFLETIFARIGNTPISKIIYHTGNLIQDDAGIKAAFDKRIIPILPAGASVSFVRWPYDQMHNRFILTDIGGIGFGIGLDDDDLGSNPNHFDDVYPISLDTCLEKDCGGICFMNNTQPVFHSVTGQ